MPTLLLIFVAAFLAFTVSALVGGGAGLVLIPILVLVVPTVEVPAVLSIGTSTSSLARIAAFRQSIRWRAVAFFVPAALPFAALGAWLLTRVQPLYLELVLGSCLAFNLVVLCRKPPAPQVRRPSSLAWCAYGAAGGFLSGFTGAIGLAFNGFYLRSGLDKDEIVATRAANELLLHLVKLGFYAGFGLLTRHGLAIGALIALAAVLAPFCARRALDWLSMTTFRRIGHATAGLAGLAMVSSAGASLAAQHEIGLGGRVGLTGIEAKLRWRDGAASLHWLRGRSPEFERTIEIAALPASVRAFVERVGQGAERVVCEQVLQIGESGYEVLVERAGTTLKFKV